MKIRWVGSQQNLQDLRVVCLAFLLERFKKIASNLYKIFVFIQIFAFKVCVFFLFGVTLNIIKSLERKLLLP